MNWRLFSAGLAIAHLASCASPPRRSSAPSAPEPVAARPAPEPTQPIEPIEPIEPAEPAEPFDPARDPEAPADVAAIPDDAIVTASGLAYKILEGDGSGAKPGPNDRVRVHYIGWTINGHRFDSSRERATPGEFAVKQVIQGWTEGLQLIAAGQLARFWIPEDLAYAGVADAPQGMLVFDIELLAVLTAPPVPADVAKPPAKAKRTREGVSYVVLRKGRGERPRQRDKVTVHYSGWTTDGELFDSSTMRGAPATFGLNAVIKGWTDVVSKMRVGATWRVWIPEKLAYEGKPGRPQGMLVFDIELLSINRMPVPPKPPRNVKRPPRRAKKTGSGLRYRFLSRRAKEGTSPTDEDSVIVHYSGWTTDGKLFDSSVSRGVPAQFRLTGVAGLAAPAQEFGN